MEKFVKYLLLMVTIILLVTLSLLLFEKYKVPQLLIFCGYLIGLFCPYFFEKLDI